MTSTGKQWIIVAVLAGGTVILAVVLIATGGGGGLFGPFSEAREAARRTQCRSNEHQLALALRNYEETFGSFPTATVPDDDLPREKRLSWTVSLLPFIEEARVYRQVDMKKAWDDPANAVLKQSPLLQYQCPSMGPTENDNGYPLAHYVGNGGVGPDGLGVLGQEHGGVFSDVPGVAMSEVHDGTSQTILFGEVNEGLGPWCAGGKPTVRMLDTTVPPINSGRPVNYGSPHEGGAYFGFVDSQVRFISDTVDPSVLKALCTIQGGEMISDLDY